MLKRLSFILICFLILSFIGEAFHHHDDGEEHPDCAVCMAVVHHKADTGLTFALPEFHIELTGTVYSPSIITVVRKSVFTPSLGRAPPA